VKRDTLLAVVLALLAVVALGVAAATLDSAVSLGGGGFGGVEGDAPSAGDGPGDPGFSPSPGGDFALATQPVCYEFLREPPALLVLFGFLLGIAAIVYRDTRSAVAALAAAGAVGFPIGLIWWGWPFAGRCRRKACSSSASPAPTRGSFPRAPPAARGVGGGGGGVGAGAPVRARRDRRPRRERRRAPPRGGDDEATPGSGAAAEDDPDERSPTSPPSGAPPAKPPIGSSRRTPTTRCTGRGAT